MRQPSAAQLTRMRDTLEDSLPDLCTLQNPPASADDQGGISSDWTNAATNVPVRIGYGNDQAYEYLVGQRFQGQMRATLTFAYNRVLSAGQRVVVGTRIFHIHGFKDNGAVNLSMRAYCTEVQV